jgi:large subunit ribosomal protein L17
LSIALIQHKRIKTTIAKAKETRVVVERLITKAKNAVAAETEETGKNVHVRRNVFSFLRDRTAVVTLFNDIAPKVSTRPGGYTRVVKLGQRQGDGAEMAIIELVDFNLADDKKPAESTKKVSTRKAKKPAKKDEAGEAAAEKAAPKDKKKATTKDSAKEATPKTKGKKAGGKDTSSAKA